MSDILVLSSTSKIRAPFWYDVSVKLRPNAYNSAVISIPDAAFEISEIAIIERYPSNFRLLDSDLRPFSDGPVQSSLICGPLPFALLIGKGKTLTVELWDTTNCGGDRRRRNVVRVRLMGCKVYEVSK
jgi:hypothetical protein